MKIAIKEPPYLIPSFYQILRDEPDHDLGNPDNLEKHFNDVYKLYLRRLADFEMNAMTDHTTENDLASILSELIKTKRALQGV